MREFVNQKVLFPAFSTSSFDLVTLLGRNFSFGMLLTGGSLLWIADCILQAGLVFYCTENRWKLFFAIPNTLSSFEPLLLSGEGALLSASWP